MALAVPLALPIVTGSPTGVGGAPHVNFLPGRRCSPATRLVPDASRHSASKAEVARAVGGAACHASVRSVSPSP